MKNKIVLLVLSCFLLACQNNDQKKTSGKLKVISSFSIITDMTKAIGKDSVEVHNLVPIGTDPHEYKTKPEDIKFASKADLFLYNGLNLEGGESGWFSKMTNSTGADPSRVFAVAKEVTPLYLSDRKGNKEVNPHAFINPKAGILMAKEIEKALIHADPGREEFYTENAKAYISELEEIEKEYSRKLNEIPKEKRILVTSERAFQYLAKEYDLKEGFIWAVDTDENGSPDQIKKAIGFVKENNPPVLFVESNVDRRPMNTISEGTGIPIYKSPLYSDELGKPGQKGATYIDYLRYNLDLIYDGLGEE